MSQKPGKRRVPAQNRTSSRGLSIRDQDTLITSQLEGVYLNPHLIHSLTSLIGCIVHVHLQNGIVYEGILKAISPHLDIALQIAHVKNKPLSKENIEHLVELKFADVVTVSATGESNHSLGNKENIFRTDVEISRSNGDNVDRELERFTDFVGSEEQSLNPDDTPSTSHGWSVDEMFLVNKEKFKVTSSYDEEMTQYTTKLGRSDTDEYKQREVRAAMLASEIETKDNHDHSMDDVGTEEEMFSSVVRNETVPTPSHQQDIQSESAGEVLSTSAKPLPSAADYETKKSVASPVSGYVLSVDDHIGTTVVLPDCIKSEQVEEAPSGFIQAIKSDSNKESVKTVLMVDECSNIEKKDNAEIHQTPTEDSKCEAESQEQVIETKEEANTKEESIRKFKLDPTAKEFNPTSSSSTVTSTTTITSPSLTVMSSSVMVTPTMHQFSGSGKKTKGPYRHKSHTQGYQSQLTSTASGGGYVISQSSPGIPGIVRPMQQVPHLTGQVLYTSVPQFSSFLASQPGIVTPQVSKFEVSPQHQVIGQQVPHATLNQQSSLLTQQGQHHLLTGVSPQVMSTPQSIFATPHHAQMINAMQEGLGSTTSVTSGLQRFDALPMQGAGLVHAAHHQAGQSYTPGTVVATQNRVIFPYQYMNIGK